MLQFLADLPYKTYIGMFFCSLFASYWLVPRMTWLARGLGLVYRRQKDRHPAAAFGGLVVGIPFLIGCALLLLLENQVRDNFYAVPLQTRGLFFGSVAALLVGLIHDLVRLPKIVRLLLQVALAVMAFHYGFRFSDLQASHAWNILDLTLSVVWIVGLINLLEVVDRRTGNLLPGLLIFFAVFLALAYVFNQYRAIVLACLILGSLIGLLSHGRNLRPGLGSSGTYLLGFSLSVATLDSDLVQTIPSILLLLVGSAILLLAAVVRIPGHLLHTPWDDSKNTRQLKILHHLKLGLTLQLTNQPKADDAWKILCRAAEAFDCISMEQTSNEGRHIRRWGKIEPSREILDLPLHASGGRISVALAADDPLQAEKASHFDDLVSGYDMALEAEALSRIVERSQSLRILLVNRYFGDMSATGQIVQEIAEDLTTNGVAVSVLAGSLRYQDAAYVPGRNEVTPEGIHIARVPATHFGRGSHFDRVLDVVFFYLYVLVWIVRTPPTTCTHIVTFTDPPFIALLGTVAKWRNGWRFVYAIQDLYPDTAHALGVLSDGPLYRCLRVLNKRLLRAADTVVAISDSMADRIRELATDTRVVVIRNWTDARKVAPPLHHSCARDARPYRVIYTGNMGLAQESTIVDRILQRFAGRTDVEFLFVGGGVKRSALQQAAFSRKQDNVRFLDYLPKAELGRLLGDSDLGLVSLSPHLEGLALPTKTYTYLAAGLPILAIGASGSDLDELIARQHAWHFPSHCVDDAVCFLDEQIRTEGRHGPRQEIREHYLSHYDRPVQTRRYLEVLRSVVSSE
jgi:colanic acid biosynthesis glycosyl transferase WcaI